MACLCGVPTDRLIRGDPLERELWAQVTKRAGTLRTQLIKAQAVHTANALVQSRIFG